nr:uncharacterized protein LOC109184998 [Ipomoea batatas]
MGRLIPEVDGRGKSNQQDPHARKGLSYVPPKPVRIFINRASSNCISTDEGECDLQLSPANGKRKSVFKRIGKIESQRSVFDRLGSNPQAPKRKSIHDRLGVVQDVKNNASHPVEAEPSKRPRSMIPSRMRREIDIHISCREVLKVQPRTIVHTRVHKGENEESVGSSDDVAPPQGEEASSFHITLFNKLIEAGFIREVKYPVTISSIVPVRKKNGQIRVCVDFRDLNVACPKDDFPLPITELMIDAVTGHEIMSFMDGTRR